VAINALNRVMVCATSLLIPTSTSQSVTIKKRAVTLVAMIWNCNILAINMASEATVEKIAPLGYLQHTMVRCIQSYTSFQLVGITRIMNNINMARVLSTFKAQTRTCLRDVPTHVMVAATNQRFSKI